MTIEARVQYGQGRPAVKADMPAENIMHVMHRSVGLPRAVSFRKRDEEARALSASACGVGRADAESTKSTVPVPTHSSRSIDHQGVPMDHVNK